MATNRLVVKEEVAVYASVLFDPPIPPAARRLCLRCASRWARSSASCAPTSSSPRACRTRTSPPPSAKELVEGVFADCHLALREVLAVMAERGQADLLPRVYDAYRELLGDKLGICVVDVTTAVPLDDGLRQLITEKAEADLGGARCCASASTRPSWAASSWMLTATTLTRA